MSEIGTQVVEETVTKAKPKKAKKAAKAEGAKPSRNGVVGVPQQRILGALAKAKGPLTRGKINEACAKAGFTTAKKFSAWMTDPLGQADPKARKAAETKSGRKSLLTLGYVKQVDLDIDGHKEVCFQLTATGRKALEKV